MLVAMLAQVAGMRPRLGPQPRVAWPSADRAGSWPPDDRAGPESCPYPHTAASRPGGLGYILRGGTVPHLYHTPRPGVPIPNQHPMAGKDSGAVAAVWEGGGGGGRGLHPPAPSSHGRPYPPTSALA